MRALNQQVDAYVAGMKAGEESAMRRKYTAKLLVEDFAALALERERGRYESAALNLEHGEVDHAHVKPEVGAVGVFEGERDSGSDCEGQKVSIAVSTEAEMQLERRSSEPGEQHVEMKQALVVKVNLDISVFESTHKISPSVVGSAAVTADAYTATVGDASDRSDSPSGESEATSGGAL